MANLVKFKEGANPPTPDNLGEAGTFYIDGSEKKIYYTTYGSNKEGDTSNSQLIEFTGAVQIPAKIGTGEKSLILNDIDRNSASGSYSHAEGRSTSALGNYSHAEGNSTSASGIYSHAEGHRARALGDCSHAEGWNTTAKGKNSHIEGQSSHSYFDGMDWDGSKYSLASGVNSHVEGLDCIGSGEQSHAEGSETEAIGTNGHSEGYQTSASGNNSHAEGDQTRTSGNASHAEGYKTQAIGDYSHAEGAETQACAIYSHAEGWNTTAGDSTDSLKGQAAHAEGYKTQALGDYSHAEGNETQASGIYSHAEGYKTKALGQGSFAGGNCVKTIGEYSFSFGEGDTDNFIGYNFGSVTGEGLYNQSGFIDFKVSYSSSQRNCSNLQAGDWVNLSYTTGSTASYGRYGVISNILNGGTSFTGGVLTLRYSSGVIIHNMGSNPGRLSYNLYKAYQLGIEKNSYGLGKHLYIDDNSEFSGAIGETLQIKNSPSSFACGRFNTSIDNTLFVVGNGTYFQHSNAFRVDSNGNTYNGTASYTRGADYAEYFKWQNIPNKKLQSLFVTLNEDKIRLANKDDDYILGIISNNPGVVGNSPIDEDRENDPEYAIVGLMGQIVVEDDGTCEPNKYCYPGENGVATASETGYRVMKRIDNNHILAMFR